jgi:hypothetical protein
MRYPFRFMLFFLSLTIILQSAPLSAQQNGTARPTRNPSFTEVYDRLYRAESPIAVSDDPGNAIPGNAIPGNAIPGNAIAGNAIAGNAIAGDDIAPEGRKSAFLGVVSSLLLPGMGELYAGRFDRGKYPFITEIALWIGAFGIDMYGDWVRDDARIFAQRHAGIDPSGKDDDFFVNIENYTDLHDYNNQRLIERRLDDLYPDESAWRWAWDTEENRKEYKDQRIHSDEMYNAVTFFVLGMVANRIWSAIQAGSAVKQYNASLEQRLSSLPSMEPRLRNWAGKVDGIELRFSW